MTDAPDHGRTLVVGLSPVVNQGVVDLLLDEGVDAQGETDPDTVADRIDAQGFGLVACSGLGRIA